MFEIKGYVIIVYITLLLSNLVYSADTTSSSDGAKSSGGQDHSFLEVTNSNFKKGYRALKQAKIYKKKR